PHTRQSYTLPYTTLFRSLVAAARRSQQFAAVPEDAEVERLAEALEQCITSMLDSGYRADAVVIRAARDALAAAQQPAAVDGRRKDRKSTRLNSSHVKISY